VPEIRPVAVSRVNPAGNVLAALQVIGSSLFAVNSCEYGTPTLPEARALVVISGASKTLRFTVTAIAGLVLDCTFKE
jgi:hypothetical protein